MKLTIEHLCAYLPYGLNYIDKDSGEITTMRTISTEVNLIDLGWGNAHELKEFKPILRRPENVSKEELIESGLDRLMVTGICKYNITREYSDDDINRYDIHHFGKDTDIPYDVIKILFSLHVDVFGLIEAGLAIDINVLEEKK